MMGETINNNNYNNNNNKKLDCTIEEFFRGKNIFLTGATGFLGTVLLEAFLTVSQNVGKIYVLVRGKHGTDPKQRLERLLSKPIFDGHSKEYLQKKIIPIVGELTEPNFGLPDEIINELKQEVNLIYHLAATINFNTELRTALKINLIGTLRTIQLAKSLDNLVSYVYLSTAFCNCNRSGVIMEKIYKSNYDPHKMIELAESDTLLPGKVDPTLPEFLKDHPNTYTLTKHLAENLIANEMIGYPAGIVRPSVIYGTYQYPMEGWSGNATSGHLGYLAGYMKGVFRTILGPGEAVIDAIPCDYVVNSSIVMGWYTGTYEIFEPEVVHCTSGEVNRFTVNDLCAAIQDKCKVHPSNKIAWYPQTKIRNGWRHEIAFFLFQVIPACMMYLPEKYLGIGMPQHTALEFMAVFKKGTKAFDFFLNKIFFYNLTNSLRLQLLLDEKDRVRYCYDATKCDWSILIERCFKGIRHFYFKEAKETTFVHHFIWNTMKTIHYGAIFGLFCLMFAFVSIWFSTPISLLIALIGILCFLWL